MRIDRKLNLIVPIVREAGATPALYVHATPISREVFETYFVVMSQAFSAINGQGIGGITGARVAHLMLERIAKASNEWEGPEGIKIGLMAEIRRLANVVAPDPKGGWTTLPLQNAIDDELIDADEVSEVMGQIVFFTLASAIYRKQEVGKILTSIFSYWGSLIELSNSTEFAASLGVKSTELPVSSQISTETESSGEKAKPFSVPH